jgi:regulator of sigma E protease
LPLGAFVRIHGEAGGIEDYQSFTSLKIWKRVLIVIGGVAAFWLAAIIIFSVVFAIGADLPVGDQDVQGLSNPQIKVISISSNSPASQAGLKAGDTILNFDKVKDFQDFAKAHAGEQVKITIKRDEKIFDVALSPRENPPAGEGAVGIGLERMATLIKKLPWYQAPVQGAVYTYKTTVSALQGFGQLFLNLFSGKGLPEGAEFAGPIGITVFLANAASYGLGFFLYFIGAISVFVAIFNLFPIPALDGGKLIFLLIEKVRGKPVSAKTEQGITIVFFIILIALSLFVTVRFDIPRLTDFFKSSL